MAVFWSLRRGGLVFVAAGLLNPEGPYFAFTSALATFGGTAFLAWLPAWVKGPREATPQDALPLARSVPWCVAGLGATVLTLAVLGPAIYF